MAMGASVVVFVAGAVLAFAVNVSPGTNVNLQTVGYILMGAGAFGALASVVVWVAHEPWNAGRPRGSALREEAAGSPYQSYDRGPAGRPYQAP